MEKTNNEYTIVFSIKLAKNLDIQEVLNNSELLHVNLDYRKIEVIKSACYDSNNNPIIPE